MLWDMGPSDPSGHRGVQDPATLAWGLMCFAASILCGLPERRPIACLLALQHCFALLLGLSRACWVSSG